MPVNWGLPNFCLGCPHILLLFISAFRVAVITNQIIFLSTLYRLKLLFLLLLLSMGGSFLFYFIFPHYCSLNSGPHASWKVHYHLSHSASLFCLGYFRNRVLWTICSLASCAHPSDLCLWVARITDVSHRHLPRWLFLRLMYNYTLCTDMGGSYFIKFQESSIDPTFISNALP
jgi:hypothetical protein